MVGFRGARVELPAGSRQVPVAGWSGGGGNAAFVRGPQEDKA